MDGYAGTGAIGVEAISRGAAHVTFVDADVRATRLITENVERLSTIPRDRYVIIRADLADAARRANEAFDLVILDPPYAADSVERALDAAAPVIGPGTRVVIEHARRSPAPDAQFGSVSAAAKLPVFNTRTSLRTLSSIPVALDRRLAIRA